MKKDWDTNFKIMLDLFKNCIQNDTCTSINGDLYAYDILGDTSAITIPSEKSIKKAMISLVCGSISSSKIENQWPT